MLLTSKINNNNAHIHQTKISHTITEVYFRFIYLNYISKDLDNIETRNKGNNTRLTQLHFEWQLAIELTWAYSLFIVHLLRALLRSYVILVLIITIALFNDVCYISLNLCPHSRVVMFLHYK